MSQCQWTIEARTDCDDKHKEAISAVVRQLARHLQVVLQMLPDKIQVEVACWSDDFFNGHTDISLLEDSIGEAEKQAGAPTAIPQELLDALRE